jgi:hypothetical protein
LQYLLAIECRTLFSPSISDSLSDSNKLEWKEVGHASFIVTSHNQEDIIVVTDLKNTIYAIVEFILSCIHPSHRNQNQIDIILILISSMV